MLANKRISLVLRDGLTAFFNRLLLLSALLMGVFLLSSCTTNSKGSSQDLASVLSVSDAEIAGATTPAPADSGEKKPKAKSKPRTQTALAATNEKNTASAKAAESVVKTKKTRTRVALNKRSGIRKPRNRRDTGDLPGVSLKKLFGILGNTEKNYDLDEPVEVASIASRARRGTFGLLLQTKNVQVGCFPRRLVNILKRVERRYRRTPIVTSGYRSRAKNRRIRGARNSAHITCKAADIQVKGVSKWQLAKYLRSLPGRGGVGTYCHTRSVHIDIGVKRDWNWRCRRRKRR